MNPTAAPVAGPFMKVIALAGLAEALDVPHGLLDPKKVRSELRCKRANRLLMITLFSEYF